jgi:hypothetical protein
MQEQLGNLFEEVESKSFAGKKILKTQNLVVNKL